jgi:hypothetical protein
LCARPGALQSRPCLTIASAYAALLGDGFDLDPVRSVLDGMTQGQSVMLATNEVMAACAGH